MGKKRSFAAASAQAPRADRVAGLADDSGRVAVSAWLLGERIDVRALDPAQIVARTPTTVWACERGLAVLHRHGIVVLFGVTSDEERALFARLAAHVHGALGEPSGDTAELRIARDVDEGVLPSGAVALAELELGRIQILAEALARSARGRVRLGSRRLLAELGDVLFTEMRMLGRAEISEKPELTW